MFCIFHKWEVKGLYYKPVASRGWGYGIRLIEELYCDKCNKTKYITVETYNHDSRTAYKQKLREIKDLGVRNFYKR